jgi:ribosomal protein S18 acetylase RimI-like enzyme
VLVVRQFLPIRRPPFRELLIGFLASTDRRPDVEPVIVEDAQPDDVPRLLEIRHAAFARHAPAAYSPAEVATLLADVSQDELQEMIASRQLFVARTATRVIVGLAGWKGTQLRHVYVDPAYTRRGIATRLLGHVEADFRTRTGATRIEAGVALHAEPFYQARGYQLVRRAQAWDGSAYLEMVRPL